MSAETFLSNSAEETIALGARLAPTLREARIALLRGDLGAGKTTLVKGLPRRSRRLHRKTYQPYVHSHPRIPRTERTLYHIDLYRIDTERELTTLGLEDLSNEDGALLLIEWGEKFERLKKLRDLEIVLEPERGRVRGRSAWADSSLSGVLLIPRKQKVLRLRR